MTENERHYASTADMLAQRIFDLIPDQPQIIALESPWKLFKVPGFKCDDLQPTMYQADWALQKAKAMWAEVKRTEPEA